MSTRRLCRFVLLFGFALMGLLRLSPVAFAQFGGDRVEGVIVDIRTDVLQVRPRFSTKLTRVILDEKTRIQSPQMIGAAKLTTGMRVFGMGDWDGKSHVKAKFVMTSDDRSGFFSMKMRAINGNSFGEGVMFAGTLKSLNPYRLVDDYDQEITFSASGFVPVMRNATVPRDALLVGKHIQASGEKTTDGLLKAETIEIQQAPGDSGSLFGEVVAVNGDKVEVRPRFATETIIATLADNADVQRQIKVDPDSIQLGDTITIKGRVMKGPADAPKELIASVILVGKQTYPQIQAGGFFAMIRGNAPEAHLTGTISSFSPFVLTLESGPAVSVTIPGQTPVANMRPASLSDAKPGDKIMLIGVEGKEGGMIAKIVVIGAPPTLGFGGG